MRIRKQLGHVDPSHRKPLLIKLRVPVAAAVIGQDGHQVVVGAVGCCGSVAEHMQHRPTRSASQYPLAAGEVDTADYVDSLFNEGVRNGASYWIPMARSTPLFYYNVEMFNEVGLTEAPKTKMEKPTGST